MTERDDSVYLQHILDAISKIEEYTSKIIYDDFIQNSLIQDAVIRQIEIMGEATKKLSELLRNKYPQLPWKDIAGIRDKLIHEYFGVDIDAVWDTVKKDIPVLKLEIEKVLKEIKNK
jgi:uncharacterized protein with HEPN domain